MREQWVEIDEFPGYAVSDRGRVMNTYTDHIKIPTQNQQGIPNVCLMQDRTQCRRSVALLVANAFLPPPARAAFDTPINMNGDRTDNHVDNLEWRPRWFAIRYHQQFRKPPAFGFTGPIELVQTGEVFEDIRDAAVKYGLLEKEIVLSAHTNTPVFPSWLEFQLPPQ